MVKSKKYNAAEVQVGLNIKRKHQRFRSGNLRIQQFMDTNHFLIFVSFIHILLIYSKISMICLGSAFPFVFPRCSVQGLCLPLWTIVTVTRMCISAEMCLSHPFLLKPLLATLTRADSFLGKVLQQLLSVLLSCCSLCYLTLLITFLDPHSL